MAGRLHHERIYRGEQQLSMLSSLRLTLCGAGALGSNLADNLARQGFGRLRVIDHDRVEEHNIGTQLYGEFEIGLWKVEALRNRVFRAVGIEIEPIRRQLAADNAHKLLSDCDLVLDTFDNSASRRVVQEQCRSHGTPCLHAGLAADYCEIIWDEHYRIPRDAAEDVCDYPLARNLVLLAVSIVCETVVTWALEGVRKSWAATLRDLTVRPIDGA